LSDSVAIALAIFPVVLAVLFAIIYIRAVRRWQSLVTAPPAPEPTAVDPTGLDSLLQSMSARVAATEGRLGAIAAELQGVAILQQRLAALEAAMPSMQEAYEKYGDQVARADKRATERDRVEKKSAGFQTAGEAADLIGGAGAGGNPAPTQLAPPPNNARSGVLGSGGRGKKFGKGE